MSALDGYCVAEYAGIQMLAALQLTVRGSLLKG